MQYHRKAGTFDHFDDQKREQTKHHLNPSSPHQDQLQDDSGELHCSQVFVFLLLTFFYIISAGETPSSTHAGVAFVAMLCFLFAATIAWFGYAYFFPHTWSGRLLIKVSLFIGGSTK